MQRNLEPSHRWLWTSVGLVAVAATALVSLVPKFPIDLPVPADDKLWHAFGYAALMCWFAQIFARAEARIVIAFVLILIGVILEIAQLHGPREVQFWDVVANVGGVFSGWFCAPPRVPNILVELERRLGAT